MNDANHKQKLLNRIFGPLKKQVSAEEPEARPVLEHLLYAVCREGASRADADKALANLRHEFFDWNEIRVSSTREVEGALTHLSNSEVKAFRIISLLQEIFETTFSFDLESLHKKGLKQAEKQLERYQAATPFVVAYTMQHGLGGHALPLDGEMQRTLRRLAVIDNEPDQAAQIGLEHLVPKARAALFCEVVNAVAHRWCTEKAPNCSSCPLKEDCPTGIKNQRSARMSPRPKTKTRN